MYHKNLLLLIFELKVVIFLYVSHRDPKQIPGKNPFNTLGTGDADLRFYRVLQSFVSFVTTSRRVTQICVFAVGFHAIYT
jgi:hypothetical protein